MMNKYEAKLLKLQTELKNFGLNPGEWTLQRIQGLNYMIQHKTDDSFTLFGRLEYRNRKPQWKSLEVYSL